MVAGYKIVLSVLAASAYAQTVTSGKGKCPSGQDEVDGKQCCPGPVVMGTSGDACCVPETPCTPPCKPTCKAKIDINDPDYQSKLDQALGSSSASSGSASPTGSSGAASSSSTVTAGGSSLGLSAGLSVLAVGVAVLAAM